MRPSGDLTACPLDAFSGAGLGSSLGFGAGSGAAIGLRKSFLFIAIHFPNSKSIRLMSNLHLYNPSNYCIFDNRMI